MSLDVRIALATLRFPATPEESITLAVQAIEQASAKGAGIVCFPECFVPGYRIGKPVPPPDAAFLERAWSDVTEAAAKANITVVLGTERFVDGRLVLTALVIDEGGSIMGFQDKVQLDPSEECAYTAGSGRRVFQAGPVTFGIVICHEGWRYPETVRWAARHGAHIVFHPHFGEAESDSYWPTTYADPANTFHEKAAPVPRRREQLLFCNRQLRERRLADHVGVRPSGWDAAQLPALRRGRLADRRHRPHHGDGPACFTMPNWLVIA
jgi:hypothetical protein